MELVEVAAAVVVAQQRARVGVLAGLAACLGVSALARAAAFFQQGAHERSSTHNFSACFFFHAPPSPPHTHTHTPRTVYTSTCVHVAVPPGVAGASFQFKSSDPNDLFRAFFGSNNPFAGMEGLGGGGGGPFGGGAFGGGGAPAIRSSLPCTLEELATGTTKRIKVTRKRGGADSEKILEIVVRPGWRAGTTVTFENEGDEVRGGGKPADLQFVIEERPHERFQRDKNDLVMDVSLGLGQALCGTKLEVKALDGRTLSLAIPEVITPGYIKRIRGEGMPAKAGKGDLVLRFSVKFPTFIPEANKAALKSMLG